jgi:two-component system, sensor histidine kinase and response regulator
MSRGDLGLASTVDADSASVRVTNDTGRPARILVVDDEWIVARDLADTLSAYGYVVSDPATTGEDAVVKARTEVPELVLMDVGLAGAIDGIEAARRICAERAVPIVYLTAHADDDTLRRAQSTRPLAFLVKPFRAADLRCAIEIALDKHESDLALSERERSLATTLQSIGETMVTVRQRNAELEACVVERTHELAAVHKELEALGFSLGQDLRAPLRTVERFSQAVLDENAANLGPDGVSHVTRVRAAAHHMKMLVEGVFRLSRVASVVLERRPVDISSLAWSVVEEFRAVAPDHKVAAKIEPGIVVDGDFGLVRILLENLIGNAWKFTSRRAAPRICIGANIQGETQVVFVRDNGVGFDARNAQQLFGIFRRFHSADEFEGTGVGLAIAQRIVNRHGGRIWAESHVGQGATFFFLL